MEENKEKNEKQEIEENQPIEENQEEQEATTEEIESTEEKEQKSTKERISKFFKKHYKKIIAGFLAVVILAVGGVLVFQSCMAPRIEEIYDRMVYLLESSQEVNALIYGCGLPVWEDDSEYVEFMHVYYDLAPARNYEIVMPNAKYFSIQQMKEAIEKIYSKEYFDEVLNPAVFDGIAISDNIGGSVIGVARYYEEGMYLWQTKEFRVKPYTGMRIYDYSTMKVRSLGKKDRCVVTVDSWLEDSPEKVEKVEILIARENGQWYLDNFVV